LHIPLKSQPLRPKAVAEVPRPAKSVALEHGLQDVDRAEKPQLFDHEAPGTLDGLSPGRVGPLIRPLHPPVSTPVLIIPLVGTSRFHRTIMLHFAVQPFSSGASGFEYLPDHNHRVEKDANDGGLYSRSDFPGIL
jgi:hypothetical protein